MSTSFPASPNMARRHHTLHHSTLNLQQANDSLTSINPNPRYQHRMNRASKTTTGGYSTRDDTEVEPTTGRTQPNRTPVDRESMRARHPLMDEIARLIASCQEHEREIRASQTTIKRKLQDFSQNFDTLTELDNQAESMTSHINHLITSHQTEHAETIATIVKQPEQMVKAIQEKLEPWKTYLKENPDDPSEVDTVVNGRGIPRIRREKEVDGLVRLEQQADVVKTYYESEQARLSVLLRAKWGKRRLFGKIISFTSTAIVLAGIVIWLLLWTFEWR